MKSSILVVLMAAGLAAPTALAQKFEGLAMKLISLI
jgi:hypothetical protein